MSEEEIERKIAVIFATDVVGYSKHMEADESSTIKNLRACEKILTAFFEKHKGRLFNTGGDSFLAEFTSAVSAVECAVEFQNAIKDRNKSRDATVKLEFRIGINSGDVVKEKENLLGDGVNIAARLEALAQTGGITISKSIYDFVNGKTKFEFNDLGIQKVKQNEFHAIDLLMDESQRRKTSTSSGLNSKKLTKVLTVLVILLLSSFFVFQFNPLRNQEHSKDTKVVGTEIDKPSILILPFENQSSNEEKDYLALGMTNNLQSTLSEIEDIFVPPASTGKFISKNNLTDQDILERYGFQFAVRGALQSSQSSNRLTVEMSDITKSEPVWSEVYDFNDDENIFSVQDNISISILEKMRIEFDRGGITVGAERVSRNLVNYKKIMKANSLFAKNQAPANLQAAKLFQETLKLEPNNFRVKTNLGWVYWQRIIIGASNNIPIDIQKAYSLALEALTQNPEHIGAISLAAAMELMSKKYDKACNRVPIMERLSISPMDFALTASVNQSCDELAKAIENYEFVMETAPHFSSWVKNRYSFALVAHGQFDKALQFFEEQIAQDHVWAGAKRNFFLLSAYIYSKNNELQKATKMFEMHKVSGQKNATQDNIRRELSMDRDQSFAEDYISTLVSLGLE